ncbi:MAG: GNAT family N-acetyltransferase [Gammaproteobacteria bacterium]|nr:GNAT family N-acetyltransferase [Gammaproteobacteria bacterium]
MPLESIVELATSDLHQLENLLCANDLPTQDCTDPGLIFYGIFDHHKLVAAGGLEAAESYVLLRSVAVQQPYRKQGMARRICDFLIEKAESEGKQAIYLLTETAALYFENLGFTRVVRERVPASIARTRQFTSLCPDSASCLVKTLASGMPPGI